MFHVWALFRLGFSVRRLLPGIGPALLQSPLGPFGDIFAPPLTAEEEPFGEASGGRAGRGVGVRAV